MVRLRPAATGAKAESGDFGGVGIGACRTSGARASLIAVFPALAGRANLCRASGAGFAGPHEISVSGLLGKAAEPPHPKGSREWRARWGLARRAAVKSKRDPSSAREKRARLCRDDN